MTTTMRRLALLRPAARVLTGFHLRPARFDALRAPGARVDQDAAVRACFRFRR